MPLSALVPLDELEIGYEVLDSACTLFASATTELTLLRVAETGRARVPESLEGWDELMRHLAACTDPAAHPVYASPLWSAFRKELTVNLDPRLRALRDAPCSVRLALRHGDPAEEILRHAEETGSDMVVMSTRAHSGWLRLLIGSVSGDVLRRGNVPVLMLRV